MERERVQGTVRPPEPRSKNFRRLEGVPILRMSVVRKGAAPSEDMGDWIIDEE